MSEQINKHILKHILISSKIYIFFQIGQRPLKPNPLGHSAFLPKLQAV